MEQCTRLCVSVSAGRLSQLFLVARLLECTAIASCSRFTTSVLCGRVPVEPVLTKLVCSVSVIENGACCLLCEMCKMYNYSKCIVSHHILADKFLWLLQKTIG